MTTAASISAIPTASSRWYRSVGAVLAGLFVNAHSLALGGIGVLLGTLGAIASWETWPHWYSLAIIAVTLPSAWLGARIFLVRR